MKNRFILILTLLCAMVISLPAYSVNGNRHKHKPIKVAALKKQANKELNKATTKKSVAVKKEADKLAKVEKKPPFTKEQREVMQKIIRDYIVNNPEFSLSSK